MESKRKSKKLKWREGLFLFGVCWIATFGAVWALRQTLIPRDELNCYARVGAIQKAVNQWGSANPDKIITDEIDEAALVSAGFLKPQTYDKDKHYHFVGKTAHGLRVKCNKHEDNPLVLKLTGDTLLALLVFLAFCMSRRYTLLD